MKMIDKFNSSIMLKLNLPLILLFIAGISLVGYQMKSSQLELSSDKFAEVRSEYKNYVDNEIALVQKVALTNSIAIAKNADVINALKTHDRNIAISGISKLVDEYKSNSGFKNVKIHIHTADIKSFLRSWKLDSYGDDLSSFRMTILKIKEIKKPFVAIEMGRAGLLIRGLAPVMDGETYLGSVEFIQDFSYIQKSMKNNHNLDILLATYKKSGIKYFSKKQENNEIFLSGNNDLETNELKSSIRNSLDLKKIDPKKYYLVNEKFLTTLEVNDFENRSIGFLLIVTDMSNIDSIIKKAQKSLDNQILMMSLIALFVAMVLSYTQHRIVIQPLVGLAENITQSENIVIEDNDKLKSIQDLPIRCNDEVGAIAHAFNLFTNRIVGLYNDVRHSDKITEEYLKAVYEGSIVSRGDKNGIITYVNDELCKITGYTREELIGKPHNIFRHPNTPKSVFRNMWETIKQGETWHGLFKNLKKDGNTFYTNITIVPIKDEYNEILEYIALRSDVTELVESKEELRQVFQTDALTSLGNRFKMINDLEKIKEPYVAIIDIRSFKEINDFYGHKNGDFVIVMLANLAFKHFASKDYEIYRLHIDTFGVIVNGAKVSREDFLDKVYKFIEFVEGQSHEIEGNEINLSLTAGISFEELDGITKAELAHQTAKKENVSLIKYTDDLKTSQEYKNNLLWTSKLKSALEEDRIVAHFQPIYNNKEKKIEKYETLVRMEENGEIISPFFFLDISRRARLYPKITKTVIEKSFETFKDRKDEFSINLSAEDIVNSELVEYLFEMMDRYEIGPRVVFEIVESESIQSFDSVERFIDRAKEKGSKIAIDDFGTGYSNFEYLIKMQTDFIKIDGSMIKDIDTDKDMYNVVETIVSFAKKNNIKTIAEYVAREEVHKIVCDLDIDYSQGYLFGKPDVL